MQKAVAKCIRIGSENKYLPIPLKLNKPYTVLATDLGFNGQFIKVVNGGENHIFHKNHFVIKTLKE